MVDTGALPCRRPPLQSPASASCVWSDVLVVPWGGRAAPVCAECGGPGGAVRWPRRRWHRRRGRS